MARRGKLLLEDGKQFQGRSFGAPRKVQGELVFHTTMTGYVEALTDPSYQGQILVLTYPLQGNYGVPIDRWEASSIQVRGLVVQHYSELYSHHTAVRSLGDWLLASGIPGICEVDTRTLTRHLREYGTLGAKLFFEEGEGENENSFN